MSFARFLEALSDHYGAEAVEVRHEIYFIGVAHARRWRRLRAWLGALRDAAICLALPSRRVDLEDVVAVVSLAGSNGFRVLEPVLGRYRSEGRRVSVVRHPRVRRMVHGISPRRPGPGTWLHALAACWERHPRQGRAVVPSMVVRCCIFRWRLWRGAWQATLGSGGGTLVMHNDFDLYASAAIAAGCRGWRSVCVQHGLPTDEFFPTRADRHLVWGRTSAEAYRARGTPAASIVLGPRREVVARSMATPQAVCLLSQTHTPVFGRSLAGDFLQLARLLVSHFDGRLDVRILLHPEEVRLGHPYRDAGLADRCFAPPHALLTSSGNPQLVVGFCSTAISDAIGRGHFVVGVGWAASSSLAAMEIGRPPTRAGDDAGLLEMLDALLADVQSRSQLRDRQDAWQSRTFGGDLDWYEALGDHG